MEKGSKGTNCHSGGEYLSTNAMPISLICPEMTNLYISQSCYSWGFESSKRGYLAGP